MMVAEEETARPPAAATATATAAAAPVPPPPPPPPPLSSKQPAKVGVVAGGVGPKLNKDGTERKKREPKKAKQPTASAQQHKQQQPTKEQLDAQRNVMRETLKQLKEKRLREEEGEGEEAAFEIESVYDLALGLELWLRDNSKVSAR
jgi:hypothetical protein